VIATARPELLTRRPDWGGGKLNAATISLAPLSDDDTAKILASLMERALLPAELQSALLARAGGNPLYAEEFARMAEGRSAEDLARIGTPDSVQGIIAARLDGLDPADKTLLHDAAVIGKAFWLGAVSSLGAADATQAEQRLHELERRRFVRRARRSSVGGEAEYAFLHVLVRDVAYGQIPRAARAVKHRIAAEWIASLGADRLEDRAELLAYHYVSALELARAAGADTSELERPARLALRSAGERALGLAAYAAAERAFAGAVELWPEDDPERAEVLLQYGRAIWSHRDAGFDVLAEARDLLLEAGDVERAAEAELMIGDMVWRSGRGADAQEHFDRAAALIEGRPSTIEVGRAKAHLARYYMVTGRSADAIRIGQEALAVAEALEDDEIRTFALNSIGTARVFLGEVGGMNDIEESIAIAERANLPWHFLRGNVNLGVSVYHVGDMARALEIHRRNLADAERYAIAGAIDWNRAEVAYDLCLLGMWDDALAIADAELARIEAGDPHYLESQLRHTRARIRAGRGDPESAAADADRGAEVARLAGDRQALLPTLSERARVLFQIGRVDDAAGAIDEVLQLVDPRPSVEWAYWIVPASMVLGAIGRADEILALGGEDVPSRWVTAARRWASGDLAGAADEFARIGSVPDETYARIGEAERLVAAGRRPEAQAHLSRALELAGMMGATLFRQQAERLLASSA
jgi:tetratricopeptide (TPR) repeat protein